MEERIDAAQLRRAILADGRQDRKMVDVQDCPDPVGKVGSTFSTSAKLAITSVCSANADESPDHVPLGRRHCTGRQASVPVRCSAMASTAGSIRRGSS